MLFQTILDLWPVLILEIFSSWNIKKGQFQLVTFLAVVFLFCKFYIRSVNQVCISSHIFEHGQRFMWRFLGFSFLVFILSLLFLAIFPHLEMSKFWSVNYVCQVCKLYFYFGNVPNFEQYLYLSVFSEHWKCLTFSFS